MAQALRYVMAQYRHYIKDPLDGFLAYTSAEMAWAVRKEIFPISFKFNWPTSVSDVCWATSSRSVICVIFALVT